jgi:hypothetical protein
VPAARVVAVLALLLAVLVAPAASAQAPAAAEPPGITVVGRATEAAVNDTAAFRFAVTSRRATAREALRTAGAALERVTVALRAAGVRPEDIRTEGLAVRRDVRRVGRRRVRQTSFVASATVRAAVRPVERAGAVVDAAVRAGATSVEGPELSVSDASAAYGRALAAAFADARAKAERLAAQAGLALGAPVRIVEGGDAVPASGVGLLSGGGGASVDESQVSGGRSQVDATVAVTFALG